MPVLLAVTDNPDPVTCIGTRVYSYVVVDCAGNSSTWDFTYSIAHLTDPLRSEALYLIVLRLNVQLAYSPRIHFRL